MLALIGVSKEKGNKINGFRILDVDKKEYKDLSKDKVYKLLKSGNSIYGLELDNRKIVSATGNFDRYPTVVEDILVGEAPLIILNEITYYGKVVAYRVCNWWGYIFELTRDYIVKFYFDDGLANGRVINGYIEPLIGEYDKVECTNGKREKIKVAEDELEVEVRDDKKFMINTEHAFIIASKSRNNKDYVYIDFIEVKEGYRSKGIGRQLYNKMEEFIKSSGIAKEIRLGVIEYRSILFWIENGFTVMEYTKDDIEMPESAIMRKMI